MIIQYKLDEIQKKQEEEYIFPYHYLDLTTRYKDIEYNSYLKIVSSWIKPTKNRILLDAGCGDGRFCYEMKNKDLDIIGLDYSKKAINFAKAFNPEIKFVNVDLTSYKTTRKFDYIVLIETLEHIKPALIKPVLQILYDLLKQDGKLIITVPSVNLPLDKKHYQHFDKQTLKTIFENYFKIDKIRGHHKTGNKRKIFKIISLFFALSKFLFKNSRITDKLYDLKKQFFENNLEFCKPEEGTRIIVSYKKI